MTLRIVQDRVEIGEISLVAYVPEGVMAEVSTYCDNSSYLFVFRVCR